MNAVPTTAAQRLARHLQAMTEGRITVTQAEVDQEPDVELRRALTLLLRLQRGATLTSGTDSQFLRSVVENIPDMIFVKDAEELRFVRFNRAGEQLLGVPRDELMGKNDFDIFPEEQANYFTEKDRQVLAGGQVVDIPEEPIDTATHGRRYLHTKKIPILDEGGVPRYLLGISEDVTERKQATEELASRTAQLARANVELRIAQTELREREQELESLVAHFPGAVWTCDPSLRLTSTAGAQAEHLGIATSAAVGESLQKALGLGEEMHAAHAKALSGQETTVEFERDGRIFEARVEPLEDRGTMAIALDVTERRRLEAQRMEARLQQAQKLESLGLLAGGIAHDFNNLLVGMLGNASLALMKLAPSSPARLAVERIETSAERASDLTRQMLAYSGRGRFVVEPVNLSELVQEMANLLEVSISKRTKLVFDFQADLPAIEADVAQMRQLVMNLITNASDALGSSAGSVTLLTRAVEVDPDYLAATYLNETLPGGRYVCLEVCDTGNGMSEAVKRRMFDPFFTTKAKGHGLGLAASLGIIRGHRGAVNVYSEPSRGTTIKVLLPCTDEVATRPAPEPQAANTPLPTGCTVLVIDDEESVRELARHVLEDAGFVVLDAPDGPEGLELFAERADEIDLVLLDMTMPKMNGDEVFKAVRAIRPDVAVVLSSGYTQQDVTSRFAGKGLQGFLQKPYRAKHLLETVRETLGG